MTRSLSYIFMKLQNLINFVCDYNVTPTTLFKR
jgi:hypothetical protein